MKESIISVRDYETHLRVWHLVQVLIRHVHLEGVDTWQQWKWWMQSRQEGNKRELSGEDYKDKLCKCSQNNVSRNVINEVKMKAELPVAKFRNWCTTLPVYLEHLSQELQLPTLFLREICHTGSCLGSVTAFCCCVPKRKVIFYFKQITTRILPLPQWQPHKDDNGLLLWLCCKRIQRWAKLLLNPSALFSRNGSKIGTETNITATLNN